MSMAYVQPVMTCDGVEEAVEHVWAKYNNTSGAIREHYLHELTLHNLFYPCPRLTEELKRAALEQGYKRYRNDTADNGDWGNSQPPNLMMVSEANYLQTDFNTGKMEKKTGIVDRRLLHGWMKNYFRPDDRQKFEWYALWLVLYVKGLVEKKDLTLFAQQMVLWFPTLFQGDAEKQARSLSKAIRIYHRILGTDPDMWDEDQIMTAIYDPKRGAGASEAGYKSIRKLFFSLRSNLNVQKMIVRET